MKKEYTNKFKLFFDTKKEIDYINEMQKKGWRLAVIYFGCFYKFKKCESDRYKAMIYAVDKVEHSQAMRAALECGYEIIPHPNDGKSDLVYLNVSADNENQEFLTDNESKLKLNQKLLSLYRRDMIILSILSLFCLLPAIITSPAIIKLLIYSPETLWGIFEKDTLGAIAFFTFVILGIISACSAIITLLIILRISKEQKQIRSEMKIYE